MIEKKMQFETSHWGKLAYDVDELGFKSLVITGPIQGQKSVHFGRLIQVRKKSGAYGSDTVLIRESDGILRSYHNMGFFTVSDEFLPLYEKAMKRVDEKNADKEGDEYTIEGNNPAVGFVVNDLDDTDGKIYSFALTITKES